MRPEQVVQSAKHVAGMAASGFITEDHAVAYLADNIGGNEPVRLCEAAILIKQDPDAIPLAVALVDRAVLLAQNPPPRPLRPGPPDTRHFTEGRRP